jgi:hypothetical protein
VVVLIHYSGYRFKVLWFGVGPNGPWFGQHYSNHNRKSLRLHCQGC